MDRKTRLELSCAYSKYEAMKEIYRIPIVTPNRITGEGRMKCRGRDKAEANIHKKRKKARKISKQSRRRNRHGT